MNYADAARTLISNVLEQLEHHPFLAPYLGTSYYNPPRPFLHQYEVVARLCLRRPVRVLIADEIGLGKTITALLVIRYLEKLGEVKRILLLLPRILINQWRSEIERMGVPPVKIFQIERDTIDPLVRKGFPEGYYLASMDLAKKREYIKKLEKVPWDLIVVDEAHRLGIGTERFKQLGKRLVEAYPSRHVLFLSATPHRGDPRDYIARLKLLDSFLTGSETILDSVPFYLLTHGTLVFRRSKEDINKVYEGREVFPRCNFYAVVIGATQCERDFSERLVRFLRDKVRESMERTGRGMRALGLLTVIAFKRASSSPAAALSTFERMLLKRSLSEEELKRADGMATKLSDTIFGAGYEDIEEVEAEADVDDVLQDFVEKVSPLLTDRDIAEVGALVKLAKKIAEEGDSKLNSLIQLLEDIMENSNDKVIVFTEYRDTLNYIYDSIVRRHPEWKSSIVKLSATEARNYQLFRKVKESFERDPKVRIMLATDVAAEGLNLQVANILVNYEVPWSVTKLEQRIGRVWRLGQKKEVEIYTFFLGSRVDLDALEIVYEKLLNIKRASGEVRPLVGQEVYVADPLGWSEVPVYQQVSRRGKKRGWIKVTEHRLISAYLTGKYELKRIIESILRARTELEKELREKRVYPRPRSREDVEKVTGCLGFDNHEKLFRALYRLLEASAEILGLKVRDLGSAIKVDLGVGAPRQCNDARELFEILRVKSAWKHAIIPVILTYGDEEKVTLILNVYVKERGTGQVLYKEPVAISLATKEVLRGHRLLEFLAESLNNAIGTPTEHFVRPKLGLLELSVLVEKVKSSMAELLMPVENYVSILVRRNMRNREHTWMRLKDLDIKVDQDSLLGIVISVRRSSIDFKSIPEEKRKAVEAEGMKIAMQYEEKCGRIPQDVSKEESYDIRSVDLRTGEVRLIEVKGHEGGEVYAELTEDEWKIAERERSRYWVYIVYDIGTGRPKLACFRDPLTSMNVKIIEIKERRYILTPRREPDELASGGVDG